MNVTWVSAANRADALAALGIANVTHRCTRCGAMDHGQPIAEGVVGLSLSHAGGVSLAAKADGPVGIDHELLGTTIPADVVAHPSETADPLRIWVRKEAVLKATGLGLQVDPSSFWIDERGHPSPIPGYSGPQLAVVDIAIDGCVAAVAARVGDL